MATAQVRMGPGLEMTRAGQQNVQSSANQQSALFNLANNGAIFYADGVLISYAQVPHCCCDFDCPFDVLLQPLCCTPSSQQKIFVPKDRILSVIGHRQEPTCCCFCPEEDECLRNFCPCVLPVNVLIIKVDDPGDCGKSKAYSLGLPNGNLVMSNGAITDEAYNMVKYLLTTDTSNRMPYAAPAPMQMVRPHVSPQVQVQADQIARFNPNTGEQIC